MNIVEMELFKYLIKSTKNIDQQLWSSVRIVFQSQYTDNFKKIS